MKPGTKWAIIVAATLLVAVIAGGIILVRRAQKLLPDLNAQRAAAELVVAYHKDKKDMPPNWEALKAYYPDGAPHREGLSFEEIQNRISIDFPALPVLTKTFSGQQPVPEIITPKSGTDAHWRDAEPNELVNASVRDSR